MEAVKIRKCSHIDIKWDEEAFLALTQMMQHARADSRVNLSILAGQHWLSDHQLIYTVRHITT